MPTSNDRQPFKEGKKFHHFIRLRVKYLAIFDEQGTVLILDDDGNDYGRWQDVESFRKYHNTHMKREMVVGRYHTVEPRRVHNE